MLAMLIRHTVEDYHAWKPVFDEDEVTRRANGSGREQVFRSADDPNELILLLEWDDLERARLYADSDDLRLALRRAGVMGQPDIWFLEDAAPQAG